MTFPIRFYSHTMAGAPQLTNTWGDLTTMLDAVLVNGFNNLSVDSITRSGSVVTVNYAAAHNYITEQIIRISGCNESDYNGDKKVTSVPTATSLTFQIDTTPATPATGTITSLTSPLGWQIEHSGTNKRIYKTLTPTASSLSLRVDNSYNATWGATYAKFGKISAAQSFADVDTPTSTTMPVDYTANNAITGTGSTAVNGRYKWYHAKVASISQSYSESTAPPAGNRQWNIVGDDRGFYFFVEAGASYFNMYCFTEFASYKTGDNKNTIMAAHDWGFPASTTWLNTYDALNTNISGAVAGGKLVYSDESGFSAPVSVYFLSLSCLNASIVSGSSSNTGVAFPNPASNGLLLFPCYIQHSNGSIRGVMPGLQWIINNVGTNIAHNTILSVAGKKYLILNAANDSSGSGKVAFDITGNTGNSWY
jgi:hypothetical protein